MDEATPGSSYTMSPTGWSNINVFQIYLKYHLMKFLTSGGDADDGYTLLLYEGHTSIQKLVERAIQHKIIMPSNRLMLGVLNRLTTPHAKIS